VVAAEVGMDASFLQFQELLLQNQQLRQENARLRAEIRALQQRLEGAERAAKRQAAPFSKGEPKKNPRKPGRKRGKRHGCHGHRLPPPPTQVDETHDAPLPQSCPDCGGKVVEDSLDFQYQTEIPRQPIRRRFDIHCGHCHDCDRPLRGRHPLQTSDATGAARSQVGPDAQAAVVYLNKHAGMSHGKIADAFDKLFGITLTRGACAQIVVRAGKKLKPVYEQIKERIRESWHLTPDETGWRIGGYPVWLHGWVGEDGATLYVIDPQRSAVVLEQVIGIDWSGSMTHDGCSSYERFQDAIHQQCVDHALRRARSLLDKHRGPAKSFPRRVCQLLTAALRLRQRLQKGNADHHRRDRVYEHYLQRLQQLTERPLANRDNERFAKHLYKHAASWFVFLLDPTIPATNHRAEQALKTPIVNRKVWGGNRTDAGGEAQAITSSVLQTCKNNAINAFHYVSNALCGDLGNIFA
jgi:transposase